MTSAIRNNLLATLEELSTHRSIVAAQVDVLKLIQVLQYILLEEAIFMSLHDNVPFQKGTELGTIFARSFQMTNDEDAHTMLGKFFARQAGYNDMDNGWEFIAGFKQGLKDATPKQLAKPMEYPGD